MFNKQKNKGFGLVEVIIVASVISLVSFAFLGSFYFFSKAHKKNMFTIKAELLAEEGLESVRLIKAGGWNEIYSLSRESNHFLSLATSSWSISGDQEIIDGYFFRQFKVYDVRRDVNANIVNSGGSVDPDTLLIEVSVDWLWRNSTSSIVYKTYVTNI